MVMAPSRGNKGVTIHLICYFLFQFFCSLCAFARVYQKLAREKFQSLLPYSKSGAYWYKKRCFNVLLNGFPAVLRHECPTEYLQYLIAKNHLNQIKSVEKKNLQIFSSFDHYNGPRLNQFVARISWDFNPSSLLMK